MISLKNILVIFLVANSIFWGLLRHSVHCSVISKIGISNCPSHVFHIIMGIICFLIAVRIRQGNFWDKRTWN